MNPGLRPVDADQTVPGVDHAVAGALVARHWNLPDPIVTAIETHHNSVNPDNHLANGVTLANQIALENSGQTEFAPEAIGIVESAKGALGVDDEVFREAVTASETRFEQLAELFAQRDRTITLRQLIPASSLC